MICYSRHCMETIMNLVFDSTKSEMVCFYHTNLSHKVLLSFVWLKFTSFGWDIDMRRIRSEKNLRLGMPKAPQGNIQGISKQLNLGMPWKASPLSSLFIGNFTWSYIFIRHMICVLLGASISFVIFCLLLVKIVFCLFSFNKKRSRIAFVMLILLVCMLLFEHRKFTAVAKIP